MGKSQGPNPADPHPRDRGPAPGSEQRLSLAKRVTDATGDAVVGGVAVILHGGGRGTGDIDISSSDFHATHERLLAAKIPWDARRREHIIDGIAVHLVPHESLGGPPKRVGTIKGTKVISLADLIRGKLVFGLGAIHRAKDLAHVVDLIDRIPLDKSFAAKLSKHLRGAFKELVEQVRGPRRAVVPTTAYLRKLAS